MPYYHLEAFHPLQNITMADVGPARDRTIGSFLIPHMYVSCRAFFGFYLWLSPQVFLPH
jgi:hypothetical protein